ncbi:MAG: cation:proton antiporter [Candidatus Krumholzibacteria bacterium]|nr:cation:proton antiporter [Candidatus Krumholzibacteria bacterium]
MFGIIIATIRLFKGPSAPDRAIALDTMTLISISSIVLVALFAGRVIYLDAAMVYAVLSFIGVVAMARHIEGGL